MVRTEFILGLIGGIFGIIGGILALVVGGIAGAFGAQGAETVTTLGTAAFVLAVVGIIGAAVSDRRNKLGGTLMIISAIGGFIAISLFYVLPAIFLIIGGVMAYTRKETDSEDKKNRGKKGKKE